MIIRSNESGELKEVFAQTAETYLGANINQTGAATVYSYSKKHWSPADVTAAPELTKA